MSDPAEYRPSAYYFRKALSEAKTLAEARRIGRTAILELEELKAWVRSQGMIPPKNHILDAEVNDKGWG